MTANYELKKGVLLQEFGFPNKACTNLTLTDELAVWHLSRHPEKAVLFVRISPNFVPIANLPPPPPPPPSIRGSRDRRIVAPEKIIFPGEDPAEKKKLIDKAIGLGFKSDPVNPVEMFSIDQLNTLISNLEKAKEAEKEKSGEKLEELRKSLKVTKVELIEIAKEKKFPVKEWEELNKPELINYLFDNLSKQIE